MDIKRAIETVHNQFPFEGYVNFENGAYTHIANTVLAHLKPGSTILDFGCGPCDKTAVLQTLGFKCTGYDDLQDDWHRFGDNRRKIINFARGLGIDLRLADSDKFPFDGLSFDMLMMHDVLEHLHDSPRELLNDLLQFLKPGGLFFATVPNAVNIRKRVFVLFGKSNYQSFDLYYWYPGPWRGHVREYVRGDLVGLSKHLSLETVELNTADYMLPKVPPSFRPLYVFITNIFRGWKDTWYIVAKKKHGWEPRKTISEEQIRRIKGKYTSYRY